MAGQQCPKHRCYPARGAADSTDKSQTADSNHEFQNWTAPPEGHYYKNVYDVHINTYTVKNNKIFSPKFSENLNQRCLRYRCFLFFFEYLPNFIYLKINRVPGRADL
jgi:hypothetical protein